MAELTVLSPADLDLLRQMVARERRRPVAPPGRQAEQLDVGATSGGYVARSPTGGIPPAFGMYPGYADCQIFRPIPTSEGPRMVPIPELTKRVHNLGSGVPGDRWVHVDQDKAGSWYAVSVPDEEDLETGTGTGTGADACVGIPGVGSDSLEVVEDPEFILGYRYDCLVRVNVSQCEPDTGTGDTGVTDHGELSGLEDDDHLQYLTEVRGDLLYEPLGVVAAHEAAGNPHPQYLTLAEGDVEYDSFGAAAAAVADHEAESDPHVQYMTQAEADVAYSGITHATRHKSGGADPIKLDELAAPTDITTLNASTSAHGLLKKLSNTATEFLNGQGGWTVPAGAGGTGTRFLDHSDGVAADPVLGDMVYSDTTPKWTRLIGHTAASKRFLTQTGNGTISAQPVWNTILSGDLPSLSFTEHTSPEGIDQFPYFEVTGGLGNRHVTFKDLSTLIMPTGSVISYGGSSVPTNFLACDGAAVSRTTYANLFAAIGTTWGAGDGSTTFNTPDLRGRTLLGSGTGTGLTARTLAGSGGTETHTLTTTEMPAHSHAPAAGSSFIVAGVGTAPVGTGALNWGTATVTTSTGLNGAHANMQPWAAVNYCIKT